MPEDVLRFEVDRDQCSAITKRSARVAIIVAVPHSPRPVAHAAANGFLRLDLLFNIADKRVKNAVTQRHPFPGLAVGDVGGNRDLIDHLASVAVHDLAGFVIAHEQAGLRRDHGVAVNHEARRKRLSPKNRAVIRANADERVQPLVLISLVSDVTHRLIHPPASDDGLLWHGAEFGDVDELGPEIPFYVSVRRIGVIVRTVIRMAPLIDTFGNWLEQFAIADERLGPRAENAQQLLVGRLVEGVGDIGQIVA